MFNTSLTWFQWNLLHMAESRSWGWWCEKNRKEEYFELENQKLVERRHSFNWSDKYIFYKITSLGKEKLAQRWNKL